MKEAKAASSAAEPDASDKKSPPFDPAGYIASMSEQFGFQLKQAVNAADARREAQHTPRQSGNVRSLRPGATHQGKSDEWERKVIWALSATRPMGNEMGQRRRDLRCLGSGPSSGLETIKTSGDNRRDQGALMAVRQARMPAPPGRLAARRPGFQYRVYFAAGSLVRREGECHARYARVRSAHPLLRARHRPLPRHRSQHRRSPRTGHGSAAIGVLRKRGAGVDNGQGSSSLAACWSLQTINTGRARPRS